MHLKSDLLTPNMGLWKPQTLEILLLGHNITTMIGLILETVMLRLLQPTSRTYVKTVMLRLMML